MACLARLIAAPRDFFLQPLSAAMPFINSVDAPGLAQEQGLGVFEIGGRGGLRKRGLGGVDDVRSTRS